MCFLSSQAESRMGAWEEAWKFFLGWSIVRWLWVLWSWQMFDADTPPGGAPALPLRLPLLGHGWRTLSLQLFLPISLCFPGALLYTDSLCWSSITLLGPLGQDSKQFQVNSKHLEYIWATGKISWVLCTDKLWMHRILPQPSAGYHSPF